MLIEPNFKSPWKETLLIPSFFICAILNCTCFFVALGYPIIVTYGFSESLLIERKDCCIS